MSATDCAQRFVEQVRGARSLGELTALLSDAAKALGYDAVTMMHHVGSGPSVRRFVAYSDYPEAFLAQALQRRYVADDPVLVACERRAAPFLWSELPQLVRLCARRREILEFAAACGLREGFTVPMNVPGEPTGSCSFAMRHDRSLPSANSQAATWLAIYAFEQARNLVGLAGPDRARPRLSHRQLECVVWAGRGKSDRDIGAILGLSVETVREYMGLARDRYGVATRQQLLSSCLHDGQITFADLLGRV